MEVQADYQRRASVNVIAGWGHVGGTLMVRYLRIPIIIGAMGSALFGQWALALSISGFAISIEPVLGQLVIREVVAQRTEGANVSATLMRSVNSMYRRVALGLGVPLLAFAVGYALSLSHSINARPLDMVLLMFSVSLSALVYLWSCRLTAILDALGMIWFGRISKLVYEVAGLAGILAGLAGGLGWVALVIGAILQAIVFGLLNLWMFRRIVTVVQDTGPAVPTARLEIMDLIVTHLASTVVYVVPMLLTGIVAGPTSAAHLSVTLQLLQIPHYVLLPVVYAWYPIVAATSLNREELKTTVRKFLPSLAMMEIIVNGWLLIALRDIVTLWVGAEFYLGAGLTLILVLGGIADFGYVSLRAIVIAIRDATALGRFTAGVGSSSLFLSYGMGVTFGMSGVLFASAAAEISLFAIVLFLLVRARILSVISAEVARLGLSLLALPVVVYLTAFLNTGLSAAPARLASGLALAAVVATCMIGGRFGRVRLVEIVRSVNRR